MTVTLLAGGLVLYAAGFGLLAGGDQPGTGVVALISTAFAVLVALVRAASPWGALWGGLCCFTLTWWTRDPASSLRHSLLPALGVLVILTLAATRLGSARKLERRLAERPGGRSASQILANLAGAALFVSPLGAYAAVATGSSFPVNTALLTAAGLAALAEAAADTVSSEVGQALAASGRTILITTLRRVPRGTDGGISIVGTLSGIGAALAVVAAGLASTRVSLTAGAAVLAATLLAFLGDSLLGATLERRGWIGNDVVNATSTIVAGLLALLFARLLAGL